MERLRLDAFDLRRAISEPGNARDMLVTELTIGETFFFREPGQMEFLRDSVLPLLSGQIGSSRPLRVWSAGSATGEEAYSLAMTLLEAGWSSPASILGTDIVPARLAVAQRGRYTQWSMRGVPDAMIERYFRMQGTYYVLRDDVRRAVDFRVLNLAANEYPSALAGVVDMDVIFCRNVLIYFDMPNVEAIARRLLASLAPDGWLFLGASDPAIGELVPCEVVLTGAGLAYRRLPEGATARRRDSAQGTTGTGNALEHERVTPRAAEPLHVEEPLHLVPTRDTAARHARTDAATEAAHARDRVSAIEPSAGEKTRGYDDAYAHGAYDHSATEARSAIEHGDTSERAWTVLIRSLANQGKLDAAGEAAAAALDRHGMSAEVSYLNGMLLGLAGRHGDAAAAFKRALYVDASYTIAHLALGDALEATGDAAGARRAFANAEALLRPLDPETVVAGADGMPAARLLHIARYHLHRRSHHGPAVSSRGVK